MPVIDKNNKQLLEEYNNFLTDNNASALQTLNWSIVKNNWECEVIYLKNEDKIIATMLVLLLKIPFLNKYLAYAPRGPICDVTNIDLVKEIVKEVDNLKGKYNIFALKFDPEINKSYDLSKLYIDNSFEILEGKDTIQPQHNMILNLKGETEESLLKRFSSKTRYNIRLADRKGIKVRCSNSVEDLKIFYDIYKTTTTRDKIGCREYSYFERMLNSFDDSNIRIYIASHEDEPLASAICINYGKKAFYIYGASSNNKRNLMPNYLMQWEMIKWGLETKCELYDFGGVFEFTNKNGLYKFKSGFCKEEGVTEFIGEIVKVYDNKAYYIYNKVIPKVSKLKKKIKKLFK